MRLYWVIPYAHTVKSKFFVFVTGALRYRYINVLNIIPITIIINFTYLQGYRNATVVQRWCNGGATVVQRWCNGGATVVQRLRKAAATKNEKFIVGCMRI
jgi:hypothetical protein